jgi:hypothetical protein
MRKFDNLLDEITEVRCNVAASSDPRLEPRGGAHGAHCPADAGELAIINAAGPNGRNPSCEHSSSP